MEHFDWNTYINNYDDLIEANINTKEKAWNHWLNHGKNEGRIYDTNLKNCLNNAEKYKHNNNLHFNIYIIGGVDVGGSLKYIDDFKQFFPNTLHIKQKNILQQYSFSINDILFIQHQFADITFSALLEIKKKFNCRIIISIHDFYYIYNENEPHSGYLLNNVPISQDTIDLFKVAELIIHPSRFTYNEYSKYFPTDNFIISPHIDFKILESQLNIPSILNNTINIGIMHTFSECKGKELILFLKNKITNYKEYKIEFKIVGQNIPIYLENEFFEYLSKYNIHCLTLLNKWGETYCYSMSKFLKSGLPIIYNNIGAVGERMPDKEYYFKVFDNEKDINIDNFSVLENKFFEMLDYIINNQSNIYLNNTVDLTMEIPTLYNNLFK
jgi:hypothetical protein